MGSSQRPYSEWAVLGLLGENPLHPFALARELSREGDLGRVLTVRRPLVYRAVDRLVADRMVEAGHSEPSDAGPERTVYRITRIGRTALASFLTEPVRHIRDVRIGFLLRLTLLRRAGIDPAQLILTQRAALAPTIDALMELPRQPDPIDLWRSASAVAVRSFLDALGEQHPLDRPSE